MNAASTPIRLAAFWLHILGQMFLGITPKQPCPHGCEFRTRDGREMAAHLWHDHAGDDGRRSA